MKEEIRCLDYWITRLAEPPKLRVLLVEDDPHDRDMLVPLFQEIGAEVLWAGSAEEGLPMISDNIDLALVNLSLPGMSGLHFIFEMRKLKRIPCAIVTGFNPGSIEQLGVAHVFSKPFTRINRDLLLEDFQLYTPHDYEGIGGMPTGHDSRSAAVA